MPTIHITNWGSHATPGRHGPGRKWTIMAIPRPWERGAGAVKLLVPDPDAVRARHEDPPGITHEQYREGFIHLVAFRIRHKGMRPEPGRLLATLPDGSEVLVADGDTLCCACGTEKARRGRCHRNWAAAFLALAGWAVVLDGEILEPEAAKALLSQV